MLARWTATGAAVGVSQIRSAEGAGARPKGLSRGLEEKSRGRSARSVGGGRVSAETPGVRAQMRFGVSLAGEWGPHRGWPVEAAAAAENARRFPPPLGRRCASPTAPTGPATGEGRERTATPRPCLAGWTFPRKRAAYLLRCVSVPRWRVSGLVHRGWPVEAAAAAEDARRFPPPLGRRCASPAAPTGPAAAREREGERAKASLAEDLDVKTFLRKRWAHLLRCIRSELPSC